MTVIFRQLYDIPTGTYTYLLGDSVSNDAVLIDPVLEQVSEVQHTRIALATAVIMY